LASDYIDWDMDDRKAMERNSLSEFVCESQLAVLLLMWDRGERADNIAFIHRMGIEDEDD